MTIGRTVAKWVAPLLLAGAGCYSVSVDSNAFRATQARKNRPYRFRVEKIDGPLASASTGTGMSLTGVDLSCEGINRALAEIRPVVSFGSGTGDTLNGMGLSSEGINRALAEIRPDLHGEAEAIPISISVSGDSSPMPKSVDPLAPLTGILFYAWRDTEGKVTVKIYTGDGVTGQKGSCNATWTHRIGLLPFSLLVPDRIERPTWRKAFGVGPAPDFSSVQSKMAAKALADAIDAMSDDEIEELARGVPRTRTETVRARLLEAQSVETIHLLQDADGKTAPVVLEHQFRETEQSAKPSHPTVLNQEYSSRTRLGVVVADATEFAQDESDDWLLRRLIPKICETKAVVIELEGLPPGDAQFSVLSDETDGNHVRTIKFRQIQ